MKKLLIRITASLVMLVALQIDYFVTREFWLEDAMYAGLSFLLTTNILRKLNSRIYSNRPLAYILSGAIFLTGLYCIPFLLLIYWGNAFSGREGQILCLVRYLHFIN